jgi:hypothetical protein
MKHLTFLFRILVAGVVWLTSLPLHGLQPSGGDDRKNILGIWRGSMPGDPPDSIELVITPTKITGRNPRTGQSLGEGTYELDPVRKTIDPHQLQIVGREKNYLGIYSLEGNALKWCSNSRTKKRPVDLVHRPDRDQFLMILERQR